MNKICIIKQPAGLGDILFTSKIRKIFTGHGFHVINPVISEYKWIGEYLDGDFPILDKDFKYFEVYNDFNELSPKTIKCEGGDVLIIPLNTADMVYSPIMSAKYKLLNIDYNDWFNFFNFKRNYEKENSLFFNVLKLTNNEKYCLISKNYGSPPNYTKYPINYIGDLRVIELDFYNGFNLFDWCKVIENAKEIHLIDSSINFIIDVLTLKTDKLHLYSRRKNNFSEINYLFKTKYTYNYD
jgi:hypothetical protein